jgi:quercetin dioxygenase-like cupin family protein
MGVLLRRLVLLGSGLVIIGVAAEAGLVAGAVPTLASGAREHAVFSSALDNIPGSRLTAVVVRYGPGEKSPPHHHAGSVFAYVLSGSVRSQNSATGPVRTYKVGEAFFEPAGSVHSISENASRTEPASLLAVFVAPDGVALTTPEEPERSRESAPAGGI